MPSSRSMLLRHAIQAEGVVWVLLKQRKQLAKAVGGLGGRLWHGVVAGYPGPATLCGMRRLCAALSLLVLLAAGCTPTYIQEDRTDRRERKLQVQNHVGGTHHRTIVADGKWYQTFSNQLLIIEPTNGRTLGSVECVPFGEGGSLVDLAIDGRTAWVVSDQTSLLEVDITTPAAPSVQAEYTAADLGVEPKLVSLAGGEVWVSGIGGVVRLRDRHRFLTGDPVGRVVQTPVGPAATVRRRIVLVEDGRYMGAATELWPLPPGFGPEGGYLFVLQGNSSAQVGLMTPAFTETASVAVPGLVRRAHVLKDALWVVTDTGMERWMLEDGKFAKPQVIKLKGGRDVDLVRPNIYAVGGTFGRSTYRLAAEGKEEGDTFFNVQREAGLLELAISDKRRVLAGGREGFWLWRIGEDAELTERTTNITSITARSVAPAWGTATLVERPDEKGQGIYRSVKITHDGVTVDYQPDGGPRITSMELVDADVWIGHDRGVDVLRHQLVPLPAEGQPAPANVVGTPSPTGMGIVPVARFRFEGPVLFIFPERIGGGASVVSLHGGFVLIKPIAVGDAPVFKGHGDVK